MSGIPGNSESHDGGHPPEGIAPPVVLFRHHKENRYSLLALLATLEAYPELDSITVFKEAPFPEQAVFAVLDDIFTTHEGMLLLCYSFMTPHWPRVKEEVGRLSSHPRRNDMVLLAGGAHPSGAPKMTLEGGFDAVCVGDGEDVFPRLLHSLSRTRRIDTVPRLYYRKGDSIRFTSHESPGDPRCVPWEQISPLPFRRQKYGPMEITRGCPFGCRYCQTPVMKGRKVRHRTPESIFRATERMVEAGRTHIRFITPNALGYGSLDGIRMNLGAVAHLLFGIRRRLPSGGLILFGTFPSEVRPEFVTRESARIIQTVCDNRSVILGAQSGNPEMLQRLRRGHDIRAVREACRILRACGLEPVVDFILGLPGERSEQMEDTLSLMEELAKEGARLHAHSFRPLPGSPWGALPPEPIPREICLRVQALEEGGRLFGQWREQGRPPARACRERS